MCCQYLHACQEISQMEADLKIQTVAYNNVKSSLQILEHKLEWVAQSVVQWVQTKCHFINCCVKKVKRVSLQGEFVKPQYEWDCEERRPDSLRVPDHCSGSGDQVSDTVGMFVCVCTYSCNVLHVSNVFLKYVFGHRTNYSQWERTYESMSEFVVPRSSRWAVFIHFWPWDKPFHLIHVQVHWQSPEYLFSASKRSG